MPDKELTFAQTYTENLVEKYPAIVDFTNEQLKVFWLPDEPKVEKDIHDIKTNFTPAEYHATITTLQLFSLYELKAGSEYWGNRFTNIFQRHEFQRMGHTFAMFELAIHKPFYKRINELLHLESDEFYTGYVKDAALKARIKFIDKVINHEDDLVSLAAFSMVEGVILYTSFAYLKHFQSKGKNKLLNVVRGINFSVRDENIHSMGGAYAFSVLLKERIEAGLITPEEIEQLYKTISEVAVEMAGHEFRIGDMIFEKGPIDGITKTQLKHFAESRVNVCLQNLGIPKIYEVTYNPIADWFYDGINSYQFNDFFSGIGNQYHRAWDETSFVWNTKYDDDYVEPTKETIVDLSNAEQCTVAN
jgi:ribonucleoside-diphosphate reductase beta chain